ncbi:VUT family protein [Acuticoccus mangrovi]|uniref:Probable queuosine precursor transporter n=1 Tax=Acuticoccus mangrovi TaxID=2796142 RepID=A0A934IUI1_9HYPH|nr:VUT family protein [Acuticoccus mangrovi]MBJ3778402.1 VUT family protein [Acuticoccus mangrovi]
MAVVVVTSNILVQYPVEGQIGGLNLADILTWGAFTYPIAFLVTDVVNRTFGPELARKVALTGFVVAVIMSTVLASPRIAIASGTAFLASQLFDVAMFHRLRYGVWWRAPLASSVAASVLDTVLFFTIAFSAAIPFAVDGFAVDWAPIFGLTGLPEAPRWVSWAIADFSVKVLISAFALGPYRFITQPR